MPTKSDVLRTTCVSRSYPWQSQTAVFHFAQSVIKTVLAGSVLMAGLLFVLRAGESELGRGPDECVWAQHVHVVEPSFAVTWAPPIHAGCFWKRGIFGRWKFICP